jgi:hypothetical protein
MKIEFRSPTPDGAIWREAAVGRVGRALHRLRRVVGHVNVRLEDARGNGRGPDKRCLVRIDLPDGRRARLAVTARSWHNALETATRRVRTQVLDALRRAVVRDAALATAPRMAPRTLSLRSR